MGNVELYQHSHIGTKDLIEQYIDSTVEVIQQLVNTDEKALPAGLETKDLLEQVVYARQAFGRSALLLSGGATLGMYHIGVLKALFHAKLLPRIISGASAGAIVCSVLCTRTDEEIPQVLDDFPYGDLAVFEDQDREEGALEHVARLLTQGAWIDIKHLTRVMRQLLGDITFQEAYNRTRRILNIGVSPSSVYELPRLLNYITSPNVLIWSAVAASCSVPVVFSSAHLLAKNPTTGEHTPWNPTPLRWIDGSVDNDLPMTRLAEMFNVSHFIVSQVNPHVVPFLSNSARSPSTPPSLFTLNSKISSLVSPLTTFAKSEALHRLHVLAQLGVFPNFCNKTRNMLSQKYSGDITILPRIEYRDFPTMLKNPTPAFMVRACEAGERATWPLLGRVRNHCAVELELDRAVTELRARVVFGRSGEKGWSGRPGSEKGVRGRYQGEGNRKRMVSGTHPRAWISNKPTDSPESAPAPNEGRVRPSIRTALSYSHAQQLNNAAAYQTPTSFIGVSTPSSVPVSSVSYSDSSTGRFLQPTVRINGPAGAAAEARLGMLPSPSTASDLGLNSVTDESEMEDSTTENEVEGEVSTPKRLFGRDK
jgi:TAG lipase/steryl ester hydrolase/phospholipase A2/LPA acyltransferase